MESLVVLLISVSKSWPLIGDTVCICHKMLCDNYRGTVLFQACEGTLQHKTDLVTKLEDKTKQMAATITEMEDRWVER